MTYEEHRGPIKGAKVAWCGDGNNMAITWIHAAARFDFELRLACPKELAPLRSDIDWAQTTAVRSDINRFGLGAVCGAIQRRLSPIRWAARRP